MIKIAIIGDSWGVPNYEDPKGAPAEAHTEFLLRDLGYEVSNYARNGGGNLHTLSIAKDQSKEIDILIWFQTDFFRDIPINELKGKLLYPTLDEISNRTYKEVSEFVKEKKCKLVAIGGQCPIREEVLTRYIIPDLLIRDWRGEILDQQLPEYFYLTNANWIADSGDPLELKRIYAEIHEELLDAMTHSEHFPDNCHPGIEPHKNLSKKISEVVGSLR